MDTSRIDDRLRETYERSAPVVNEATFEAQLRRNTNRSRRQVSVPKRRTGLRLAVYASIAVVLVAAIAIGSLEAVKYLGKDQPILVITDDTLGIATTGQTTQTTSSPEVQAKVEIMTSAPLELTAGGQTWTLAPEEVATYLDYTSESVDGISSLVPRLSAEKMSPFFAGIAGTLETAAADATFEGDGTKAWVVPGVDGRAIDAEKTAEALTAAALKTTGRTAEVIFSAIEPDLTTTEAEAMGIKDRLASYTTEYAGTASRQHNVSLTTEYASDVILAPGEEYDFDEQVGPRTTERGYTAVPGIVGPGNLEDVFDGALCQVSTTLFNAAFLAGLEIVERHNGSIYIDHYPTGRDAAVTGDGKDFRFNNDTDHYLWIVGESDGVTTTFHLYGTDDGRKVRYTVSDFYDLVPRTEVTVPATDLPEGTSVAGSPGQDGKRCEVVRTVTWAGGSTTKGTFVSIWPMMPREIQVGASASATTAP